MKLFVLFYKKVKLTFLTKEKGQCWENVVRRNVVWTESRGADVNVDNDVVDVDGDADARNESKTHFFDFHHQSFKLGHTLKVLHFDGCRDSQ